MSFHEFLAGKEVMLSDFPFYGLVQAAMRQADDTNLTLLRTAFPAVWAELQARYNAPGGVLPEDGQVA
jgi:hypothetical protein